MYLYLLLGFGIGAILFFVRTKGVRQIGISAFVLLQWLLTFHAYFHTSGTSGGYFTFDALGIVFLVALSIVSVAVFYHSHIFFETRQHDGRLRGIYYGSLTVLIASLSAAYLSNHPAVTWIFIELTTLSSSALIYHNRNERTLEATWKYVFVCSVSITLVFIGILLLTLAVKAPDFSELSYPAMIARASQLDAFWLKVAFIFIFTGFTAKAGLVPMFTVGIDAKDKAPGPAGALLASGLVNAGFIGIFRTYEVINNTDAAAWANTILIISALLSIFVSAVYIIRVKNVKRMLAYSGMEHMGIAMLGLASGGAGHFAALLHLVLHSFAKPAMFFQVDQMYRIYKSKSIYDIGDYFRYHTPGAIVLLLSFFTITAMPPSGMFVSEFMIFRSIFASDREWILAILAVLLAVVIASLGKNIFKMLFIRTIGFADQVQAPVHPIETASQYILLGLAIYLGFNPPNELVALLQDATKNLKV